MDDNKKQRKLAPKSHSFFVRNKWLFITAAIISSFLIGAAVYWVVISGQKSLSNASSISSETNKSQDAKRTETIDRTEKEAQKILDDGGTVSEAVAVYNNAIDVNDDTQVKSDLLLNKAILYFNNGKYDEALVAAKESDDANQNEDVEQFIAQIYEIKADNQNAIIYYQKAISHIDKTRTLVDADIQYYQDRIRLLEGGQ